MKYWRVALMQELVGQFHDFCLSIGVDGQFPIPNFLEIWIICEGSTRTRIILW